MNMRRVHWLQHVPFEGLGSIEPWLQGRGYQIRCSRMYAGDRPPAPEEFDWLIVMGGPMNVDELAKYPWLQAEKRLIRAALDADKRMLGICLGAQLMARALGAKVVRSGTKEIGWFPVDLTEVASRSEIFDDFERTIPAYHWHGDSFELPPNAMHAATSAGCRNQAFVYGKRALALQFHLETTEQSATALIKHCAQELEPGEPYIQSAQSMLAAPERFAALNGLMDRLLENLAAA